MQCVAGKRRENHTPLKVHMLLTVFSTIKHIWSVHDMNGHLKISQHENTPDIFNLQYNYEPEDFHVEQCI